MTTVYSNEIRQGLTPKHFPKCRARSSSSGWPKKWDGTKSGVRLSGCHAMTAAAMISSLGIPVSDAMQDIHSSFNTAQQVAPMRSDDYRKPRVRRAYSTFRDITVEEAAEPASEEFEFPTRDVRASRYRGLISTKARRSYSEIVQFTAED